MSDTIERIVLGGGCFWCIEAVYKRIEGINRTQPGYAGGHLKNPDYKSVCSGNTGHAEVVEVSYDSNIISLESVLEIFWRAHDPTTLNRQGNDVGSQYRSAIFYENPEQKQIAEESLRELTASGAYPNPPVTQIVALETFWPAEDYHKDYFEDNGHQSYCRLVIAPKLHKMALLED